MAYKGDWGTFVHIVKCGGFGVRENLRKFGTGAKEEVGPYHGLPWYIKNGFTVIRHPAVWLRSFWTYRNNTDWEDSRIKVANWPVILGMTQWAKGKSWIGFLEALFALDHDIVSTIYGIYRHPNVKIYKLEKIARLYSDLGMSPDLAKEFYHVTPDKPEISMYASFMLDDICKNSLKEYNYPPLLRG